MADLRWNACSAAMLLNNTGVSLLEQGMIEDAMDLLRDAIAILNQLPHCEDPVRGQGLIQALQTGQDQLRRVHAKALSFRSACDDSPNAGVAIDLVGDASTSLETIPATLIRLQPASANFDFDYAAVTVLYNFGVAHYALHRSMISKGACHRYLCRAGQLLEMACKASTSAMKDEVDMDDESQRLYLRALILHIFACVRTEQGELSAAAQVKEELDHVIEWIRNMEELYADFLQLPTAAPAA